MKYEFPAVISYDSKDKIYYVEFPDIKNCFTDGENLREALDNAEDVLNLMLLHFEETEQNIPRPTITDNINLKSGEIVTLVKADTNLYSKIAV